MNSALLSPQRLVTVFAARLRRWMDGGERPGRLPLTRHRLRFLVIRLDQIGDTILTTPLFRELRRSFPDSHCTAVVRAAAAPLLETNPNVDEVLTMPVVKIGWLPEWARKVAAAWLLYKQQLRGNNYDIAIMPRWDMDLDLATFVMILANARTTVGYSENCSPLKRLWNAGFDRVFSVCVEPGPVQHEVLRSLDLLRAIGGEASDDHLQLCLLDGDAAWASSFLATVQPEELLVVIGFATNNGPSREWPLENYAKVISTLQQRRPVRPVLVTLPSEKSRADKLSSFLDIEPLVATGEGLRNFAALLARCDLFIGNDSGLAHLAAAVDLPIVVISPHPADGDPNHLNSPQRFGPFAANIRIIQPEHGRDACITHCANQREAHCICSVTPERVVEAASAVLLARSNPSSNENVVPFSSRHPARSDPPTSPMQFAAVGDL